MSAVASPPARAIGTLMVFEATTLAITASVHFAGRGVGSSAAVPETVIGIVLAGGAVALIGRSWRARRAAAVAVGFAIAGFGVGLSFTIHDGSGGDLAYHAAMLPLLAYTLVVLLSRRRSAEEQRE